MPEWRGHLLESDLSALIGPPMWRVCADTLLRCKEHLAELRPVLARRTPLIRLGLEHLAELLHALVCRVLLGHPGLSFWRRCALRWPATLRSAAWALSS